MMKEYKILIKNMRVQKWFNYLYDRAELSQTIEELAIENLDKAERVLKGYSKRENS